MESFNAGDYIPVLIENILYEPTGKRKVFCNGPVFMHAAQPLEMMLNIDSEEKVNDSITRCNEIITEIKKYDPRIIDYVLKCMTKPGTAPGVEDLLITKIPIGTTVVYSKYSGSLSPLVRSIPHNESIVTPDAISLILDNHITYLLSILNFCEIYGQASTDSSAQIMNMAKLMFYEPVSTVDEITSKMEAINLT